jgi:formylglycine-generating enzyme required for sulfatase activity
LGGFKIATQSLACPFLPTRPIRPSSQLATILLIVGAIGSSSCRPLPPPKRVTTNIGLKLTYIPPGSFTMGAEPSEPGAKPAEKQHKVTISKGF